METERKRQKGKGVLNTKASCPRQLAVQGTWQTCAARRVAPLLLSPQACLLL